MKFHKGKAFRPVRVARTWVKDFAVYAHGREVAKVENNFHRLVHIPLNTAARELSIRWLATNGDETDRLFFVYVKEN